MQFCPYSMLTIRVCPLIEMVIWCTVVLLFLTRLNSLSPLKKLGDNMNCAFNIYIKYLTVYFYHKNRKMSTASSGEEELHTSSDFKVFCDPQVNTCLANEADFVRTCAVQYKLRGKSLGDLCEHNANVAASGGRPTVKTLKILYYILFVRL